MANDGLSGPTIIDVVRGVVLYRPVTSLDASHHATINSLSKDIPTTKPSALDRGRTDRISLIHDLDLDP